MVAMAEDHALIIPETGAILAKRDVREVKDVSQNPVSGDFERQYINNMQTLRRQRSYITLSVCVGALAFCMVAVALVRELQIARLRREVEALSANMIIMSADIKSLNQKLAFYDEDSAIYADEEVSANKGNKQTETQEKVHKLMVGEADIPDTYTDNDRSAIDDKQTSLDKLHGLTVQEDDTTDDEDIYPDDDDEESGDWYRDYDLRREKIGTSNMVRLKPEDFEEAVLTLEPKNEELAHIKKLLNENPENPDLVKALATEVPELSYSESQRIKRNVLPETTSKLVDSYAAPRVYAKDERRKTKKFPSSLEILGSTKQQPAKVGSHTVTRRSEGAEAKPFIAAHFHGNTSHLSPELHEHYKGNGLIRLAHGAAHDVWYPSPWTLASPHPRPTLTRKGHIHVHHTGVYLVYVQIYYLDSHDIISWVLHRTNADLEQPETLLQCAQSAHSAEPLDKPNSCFSAAALFLKSGDRLAVRNTGGSRHSLMEPEKSFIGLVKLADAEDPTEEL